MMLSDLKHVIENVNHGNNLKFEKGKTLKVKSDKVMSGELEFTQIYKEGRSWRIATDFGNYETISTLPEMIQSQLYRLLLSHFDTRRIWSQTFIADINEGRKEKRDPNGAYKVYVGKVISYMRVGNVHTVYIERFDESILSYVGTQVTLFRDSDSKMSLVERANWTMDKDEFVCKVRTKEFKLL